MTILDWKRKIEVRVAGLTFSEGKIAFELKRESNSTPAKGTITLTNLSRDHEQVIEKGVADETATVVLSAGYQDRQSILFDGYIQRVERTQDIESLTRTTTITLAAAVIARHRLQGVSRFSFKGDRPLRSLASLMVADMGLILGPLDAIPDETISGSAYSYSGPSAEGLTALLTGYGIQWYEDDGVIRFNSKDLTNQHDLSSVLVLKKETGLIGSPSVSDKGVLTRSTLKPLIKLGGVVRLDSETTKGLWKVISLYHAGDNWRGEFQTELNLRQLQIYDQTTLDQLAVLPESF